MLFRKVFSNFNCKLYLVLLIRLIIPTVYNTFRVSILGSLPDTSALNIASQLQWVNVIFEKIEESILMPLYFCLGDTIQNVKMTKNKVKTGVAVSGIVYAIFCVLISSLAWPLIDLMGQNQVYQMRNGFFDHIIDINCLECV